MAVFVMSMLMVSMASALTESDVKFVDVEVNDNNINFMNAAGVEQKLSTTKLAVEEGGDIEIIALLEAGAVNLKNLQVEADIFGYEYDDYTELEDTTHNFDIQPGSTKSVKLTLTLPKKLDKKNYSIRLRIADANSASVEKTIELVIEPSRHGVDIKDVSFSPGATVKAGRSLLTTVLLENFGDKHEKDVKVTVSIPSLGVSATEYMDALKMDDTNMLNNIDYEDVPEMFLAIPADAAAGTYKVDVVVKYDDLRETVTKSYNIEVVENEMFQKSDKLVLMAGPDVATVAQGNTATYGVALSNQGTAAKAFTVSAMANGANAAVSESLVVLNAGQSKVVYVTVTPAANAAVGAQPVTVTVKSGASVVETVTLTANVVEGNGSNFNLRGGLEIALIVLVVLLVIIGLIVGFSRLRKDDEEEQTYY